MKDRVSQVYPLLFCPLPLLLPKWIMHNWKRTALGERKNNNIYMGIKKKKKCSEKIRQGVLSFQLISCGDMVLFEQLSVVAFQLCDVACELE